MKRLKLAFAVCLVGLCVSSLNHSFANDNTNRRPPAIIISAVQPIPDTMRSRLTLDNFYQQYVDVSGLPIVGSAKVRPEALLECAWLVKQMLVNRPDILQALVDANVRFTIMAHDEYTTDVPEYKSLSPKEYWDKRARGLGATFEIPVVSGGEENLLAFPGDPYPNEIIPLHEFAHAIHIVALAKLDPTFQSRLDAAYKSAMDQGLWKDVYAATNEAEYWAEAVQSWFDNNDRDNAMHNSIDTRDKLKEYDPRVAALCQEVFGDNDWKYLPPKERSPEDRAHLETLDGFEKPHFRWREQTP